MLRARSATIGPVIAAARAVGRADHQRQVYLTTHHVMHFGSLIHDLVVTAADEVHEHDFDNRTQAGHCCANARAKKTHLGDRSIENAFGPKLGNQAARCAKWPSPGVNKT